MTILNSLSPKEGAVRSKKRLGCGRGSGHGETSTRGQKGQKSRSGDPRKKGFEGGQMPLFRRIPKRGFSNVNFEKKYELVRVDSLGKVFSSGAEITPQSLLEKGLVKDVCLIKILGDGELKHPVKVSAHAFSKSAKEKIEKAGGSVNLIANK